MDDRASDSLPTRPKGNGSLSGRARERKLLVGKGERRRLLVRKGEREKAEVLSKVKYIAGVSKPGYYNLKTYYNSSRGSTVHQEVFIYFRGCRNVVG